MFKSLQSMGGVITVFKKPQSDLLTDILLSKLNKNQVLAKTGEYKYDLDITINPPTLDQFQYFQSCLHTNPICKRAFRNAFPELTNAVNLINDLQKLNPPNDEQISNKFIRPLIVDWDHKLLAHDEASLDKILDQYNGKNDDIVT